jgi:DNA-3-methyladenine glycosylase I
MNRCDWAESEKMHEYHDDEWGVPVHGDRKHFEFLILEGAQAGLSWATILKRRDGYFKAFAEFDPQKVAKFTQKDENKLLKDEGIIRNKLKVKSAVTNAKRLLEVQKEFGSFDKYIWEFVNFKPINNGWKKDSQIPATSEISIKLSKDLKKRGFQFVGPTIIYAHMQAIGMVNDHVKGCFRYNEIVSMKG